MWNIDLIKKYAPIILFDQNEPFFPVRVGVSFIDSAGPAPSFDREFLFDRKDLDFIIEYAIYWDFDIQHLYELEHVWVYVGKDGSVINCDASSHGSYHKVLLDNHENLEGTQVKIYSEPGKHAFSTNAESFGSAAEIAQRTYENAGNMGLIMREPFYGTYEISKERDRLVEEYLQKFRFKPSMSFERYNIPDHLFVTWNELHDEVPKRIERILKEIRRI